MSNLDRLPKSEGYYFWDEWSKIVLVYLRGKTLHTRVYSHWPPIKISPRIAGKFTEASKEDYERQERERKAAVSSRAASS